MRSSIFALAMFTMLICVSLVASAATSSGMSPSDTKVDTEKPVITRLGDASALVFTGGEYVDAGATATDACDGNLTSSIVVMNTVNTSAPGIYIVRYNVFDATGNGAVEETREVAVEDPLLRMYPSRVTVAIDGIISISGEARGLTGALIWTWTHSKIGDLGESSNHLYIENVTADYNGMIVASASDGTKKVLQSDPIIVTVVAGMPVMGGAALLLVACICAIVGAFSVHYRRCQVQLANDNSSGKDEGF